jgi:Cof subfamily protein (haloacid dehalogenase superfamily)
MPIKLLALDIDGTLLTPRGEITPRTRAVINEALEQGVQIVLVTGRRFGSAYLVLQEYKLDLPLISHNGALSKDLRTLETLELHPLEIAAARDIIRTARKHGADMVCCNDEPRGLGKMAIEGIFESNQSLARYLDKYRDAVMEVPDLVEFVREPPIQIMFSGRCAPMESFAGKLQGVMGERIRIFQTRYPQYDLTIIDAVSVRASKGESVARIAERYGIARAEVMAVGDNHNDLTMLQYAGLGVVMGNAEAELKELGFALTSSNEEDGVAEAIERFIFEY